jgi:WD40 repeat protein
MIAVARAAAQEPQPVTQPPQPSAAHDPFPSLAALRAAHNELLRSTRDNAALMAQLDDLTAFIHRGAATGMLLEDEDDRTTAQSLLDYWSAAIYRVGQEPPDATLAEFDSALEPDLDDSQCPYVGLEPFTERTSDRFFGRQRLTPFLIDKIRQHHMVALVGPAGGGKSSVLRAGVVAALQGGALDGSADWRFLPPITPTAEPLAQLLRLCPGTGLNEAQQLRTDPAAFASAMAAGGSQPAVLVVDQLEELFMLCHSEADQRAFIDQILNLVEAPGAGHVLLTALRSDFESQIARFPNLQASFERGARVQVLPLTAPELRDTIEKPAALVGLKFEAGIVDRLIAEMLGEPAALPLLQFTLLKLWDHRQRSRITWAAYNEVGSGRLAVARSADAFYRNLTPDEQSTARRVLLYLARPLRSADATSRHIRLDTLLGLGEPHDRVVRIVEKLRQARLVRVDEGAPGGARVEIAHEALVRNWPTLVGWLDAEQSALEIRRNLESRAAEWMRLGQNTAGLLDAVQIAEAERWLASSEARYLGFDPALPVFVQASRAAVEENQQREVRQAQALAEAQRQRAEEQERGRRRMTRAFVAIGVLCILALVTASYAVAQANIARRNEDEAVRLAGTSNAQAIDLSTAQTLANQKAAEAQQNAAEASTSAALAIENQATAQSAAGTAVAALGESTRQRRQAYAGRLAAQAQAVGDQQPQLALLLASESIRTTTLESEEAAPIALSTLREALVRYSGTTLFWSDAPVVGLAFTTDGRLVSASADKTVRVWDSRQPGNAPRTIALSLVARSMAMSPNGRALVVVGDDNTAELVSLDDGSVRPIQTSGAITAVAVSLDGSRVALAADNGETLAWDVGSQAAPRSLRPSNGAPAVRAATLSPNGRLLLTGSDDGIARLYDLNRPDPVVPTATITRRPALTAVAMSPNGRWAVIGSADGATHLWSLSGSGFAAGPYVLSGQTRAIRTITVSPDSTLTATGSEDGTTFLWRLDSRDRPAPRSVLRGHSRPITGLQISPDNTKLISASADGTAAIWDMTAEDPGATQQRLLAHEGPVNAATLSADGALLATGSDDRSVHLWDVAQSHPQPDALPAAPEDLIAIACRVAGRSMTAEEWQRYVPPDVEYRATCGT